MKYESTILLAVLGLVTAAPTPQSLPRAMLRGREVPQEHSHNRFLDGVRVNLALNNPAKISDPVFGLLGSAAAAAGQGSIANVDCLHQATADQAFTNAKAAGNVTGQSDALLYAALERNTGSVGLASVICPEKAVNPEIAAVQQHQDPASPNAAATNKAVVLALAQQLASIGADPQEALLSGTFAPGKVGDPTAAGNTCDTADDVEGCIFSQKLIQNDATADEITAAVAGVAAVSAPAASAPAASAPVASAPVVSSAPVAVTSSPVVASACIISTVTVTASEAASIVVAAGSSLSAPAASTGTAASATVDNVQTFTGALGGPPPPVISSASDRPFSVDGSTFVNISAALQRSCSVQHNACADAANAGTLSGGVGQCETQETACNAAAARGSAVVASAPAVSAATATATVASAPVASATTAATATVGNVQTFTGTLGGPPPPVTSSASDRPFAVDGSTFVNIGAALQRSCSVQHTNCANDANAGTLSGGVGQCDTQDTACNAAAAA